MASEPGTTKQQVGEPRPGAGPVVSRFARMALDLLLPPQCLACETIVAEPGRLCARGFAELALITPPLRIVRGPPSAIRASPQLVRRASRERRWSGAEGGRVRRGPPDRHPRRRGGALRRPHP